MSDRTCSIEGCTKPHASRGWCQMHYTRWARHGDPLTKKKTGIPTGQLRGPGHFNRKAMVTYISAHQRIRSARGLAADYLCVDCGGTAKDWSYIGGDPDEIPRTDRWPAYSLDPAFYVPRCRPCHVEVDGIGKYPRKKGTR